MMSSSCFFNDTATTEIYTLSLHDALPIYRGERGVRPFTDRDHRRAARRRGGDQRREVVRHLRRRRRRLHRRGDDRDWKSTRLNSSHANISYAVFCLKKHKSIPSGFTYTFL